MEQDLKRLPLTVHTLNTVVVGSGAAGFNAADRLYQYGQTEIALITEGVTRGTSRNTGSDKQTYYKLTLSSGEPDSVREMADTLFAGGCVDGDVALCEAALSAQSFLRLAELGVPFPRGRYGEYVGYKTDHDPRRRATSVGPYTSRCMTECLERAVREKGISIFDQLQVVRILSDGTQACGLLCLDNARSKEAQPHFVAFHCKNIIWCTGGPAGIYADSVYPLGHYGATGLALEAGARGQNLTEWQYGLASVQPRWNVSGTYMQVLPRFLSTEQDGTQEREFLYDFFDEEGDLLTKVFLKGYQWPFDVRKVADGSSVIDILVYLEQCKGRRVFLDFRTNPSGKAVDFSALAPEARSYLEQAGACFGTPLERLLHMNAPAVEFYRDKGVDLAAQPLEIALCAQHNNGGLAVDCWWRTSLHGLFCAGEAAGSHGVYRPGGSALNAGQVGSTRAAQYIAARCTGALQNDGFRTLLEQAMAEVQQLCSSALCGGAGNVSELWNSATRTMSELGAAMRSEDGLQKALGTVQAMRAQLGQTARVERAGQLRVLFRLREVLLCQQVYLQAMLDYLRHGGASRGSALYTDPTGKKPYAQLPDLFTFRLDEGAHSGEVQEVLWQEGEAFFTWRPVRPIPEDDDFFENVWRSYRETGNIG